MKWLGLAGVTGLAGCAGGGGDESGTGDGSGTDTSGGDESGGGSGGIKTGGHLRVGFANAPQQLNPMKGITSSDYVIRETMYSRLTNVNRELELEPELAKSWETNDAFDEYTFILQDDAKFATIDQEVLAEDVKATVEVMKSEDRVSSAARDLGPIESVEIEDDKRITFSLSRSDIVYPKRIAETGSTFNILPKNVIEGRWDELSNTDFGSGPFTLTEYSDGSEYAFEAHDGYYKSDDNGNELPYVDKMTWRVNTDAVSRVNAVVDERTDALQYLGKTNKSRIDNTSGMSSKERGSPGFQLIVLNENLELDNGEKPFSDVKVRKAFKHAMDREEIKSAANDSTVIGHHDPVSPVHEYYADFDPGLEFGTTAQPDEAKRLLEEAGYGDGLDLPQLIYSANAPITPPMIQVFQEQMGKVGINFEIQQVTEDTWLSDYWNSDKNWYWSEWSARIEDTTVHRLSLRSDGPWNSGRYSNEEYDKAYDKFINATDRETFKENFSEAQKIFHKTGPWLILGHLKVFTGNHDYVGNVDFPPSNSRSYHWNDHLSSDAPEGPS
ncbi:ABC transporter substrate-binding protein [Haloarculaceae archaeon H-GB2-1]|nr:ABC transporter substrate-binding protein [Haloarculaceae archaeon H-GB1-1]MEA5387924.1 ABC transporter substrate-binding protein [Haloarculaceae archaeon H-GB11]MEA5409418.1 ABC transporter substrate-binding protein [Haloarculaceae archaeon H-GB2-1]